MLTDIDDPILNRSLLMLFCERFELCVDFKNLYVYRHKLSYEMEVGKTLEQPEYQKLMRIAEANGLCLDMTHVNCENDFPTDE